MIHSSYYRDPEFGNTSGYTILTCRFPRISLNVGQFHLCTYLQEQRSGDTYEYLDGICVFEVVRIDEQQIGGWRPEICAYHEQHAWAAVDVTNNVATAMMLASSPFWVSYWALIAAWMASALFCPSNPPTSENICVRTDVGSKTRLAIKIAIMNNGGIAKIV